MSSTRTKRLTPTPTQIDALIRGREYFKTHDDGLLVAACSVGKTLISQHIVAGFTPQATKVLVVVPNQGLIKQVLEDWQRDYPSDKQELELIAICSDQGVSRGGQSKAKATKASGGDDSYDPTSGDMSAEEFQAQLDQAFGVKEGRHGVTVTTEVDEIRSRLTAKVGRGTLRVVACTFQSTPTLAKALAGSERERKRAQFDIAIVDEAHHTMAPEVAKGKKQRAFQTILNRKAIPAARRLYMTATPRFSAPPAALGDQIGLGEKDAFSMFATDTEKPYGDVFYEVTVRQGIQDENVPVVPYRVVPAFVRKSDLEFLRDPSSGLPYAAHEAAERDRLEETAGERGWKPQTLEDRRESLEGRLEQQTCAAYALDALIEQHPEFGVSHILTYHASVDSARGFRSGLLRVNRDATRKGLRGKFEPRFMCGQHPMKERARMLERFSRPVSKQSDLATPNIRVVTNCKALVEGVNVNGANAVLFADKKQSPIEVMQALGRVIRKDPRNPDKVATLVVPILVDDRNPADMKVDPVSANRFKAILWALKQNDADVAKRIEIPEEPAPTHPLDPCGKTLPKDIAQARRIREVLADRVREVVESMVDEAKRDIRQAQGRPYYGTNLSMEKDADGEEKAYWRIKFMNEYFGRSENPAPEMWGTQSVVELPGHFDNSEEAAEVVDRFLIDAMSERQTNFGHNPNRPEEELQRVTSRYPGKVSYAKSRSPKSRYRAYIDDVVYHPNGEPVISESTQKPLNRKITRYFGSEEEAVRSHDAHCYLYGYPERFIDERFYIDPTREADIELAIAGDKKKDAGVDGVALETYLHHEPDGNFLAFVECPDGITRSLGWFATTDDARKRVDEVEQQLAADPDATIDELRQAQKRMLREAMRAALDPTLSEFERQKNRTASRVPRDIPAPQVQPVDDPLARMQERLEQAVNESTTHIEEDAVVVPGEVSSPVEPARPKASSVAAR